MLPLFGFKLEACSLWSAAYSLWFAAYSLWLAACDPTTLLHLKGVIWQFFTISKLKKNFLYCLLTYYDSHFVSLI